MSQQNPVTETVDSELARRAAAVDPAVRAVIARAVLASQRAINRWPYYSRIRFQTIVTDLGGGVFSYSLTQDQQSVAFSYGVDDPMTSAGFPVGRTATLADTNISEGRKTKAGEDLWIYGVSIYVVPLSDPILTQWIFGQAQTLVSQNGGDDQYKVGPLIQVPSSGGLFGTAPSFLATPDIGQEFNPFIGTMSNGLPINTNYLRFPERIRWTPSGERDSTLTMPVVIEQPLTLIATARAAAPPEVVQYDPPPVEGALGTYVELLVQFHAEAEYDRSLNQ